jgi:hypothetical protein
MKKLFILAALLCIFNLYASPNTHPNVHENLSFAAKVSIVENPFSCPLPAPTNFVVTGTSSTSISLQWDAVPGAFDYRIGAAGGPGVPPPPIFTTATSVTFNNLTPGTDYNFTCAAGCGNNTYSINIAQRSGATDFIIEIVYNGFSGAGAQQAIFNGQGSGSPAATCPVALNQCYVGILRNGGTVLNTFTFNLAQANNQKYGYFWEVLPPPNNTILTAMTNSQTPQCSSATSGLWRIHLAKCASPVSTKSNMRLTTSSTTLNFEVSAIPEGHTLTIYECSNGAGAGGGETKNRDQILPNSTNTSLSLLAAPNPFTNEINLTFTERPETAEPVAIELFDLQGKLHLQQYFNSSSDNLSLPTQDLPLGMYFLRARVGDTVKTIKVVKTE